MRTALTTLAAGCLLQSTARAAEESETKASMAAASSAKPGDTDFRSLLRDVGQRVQKKFVWDARLPPTVDLGTLQRQDLSYSQLLALLELNGFVTIERRTLILTDRSANVRRIIEIARAIDALPKGSAELQPQRTQ
jgi:hypothetical protein